MAKFSQVIIAEKPSLARAIADGISSKQERQKGYILVDGKIAVTNLFGHMLELAAPGTYKPEWKKWDVETLPYNPAEWKLVPKASAQEQLDIVHSLIQQADCVVNAGDPDREGQLLVDEVLEYFNWKGKTLRLLLSSTDLVTTKKALASMKDNKEFINLYHSALCRSRADWIVGMSLTVAATKLLSSNSNSGSVISIGRVQTPTLALIVNRDLEIENFKSKNFFTLKAFTKVGGVTIPMVHAPSDETRIYVEADAKLIAEQVSSSTYPINVVTVDSSESPGLPFSLQTLQKEAGIKLGLSANEALSFAQELYEKRLTSYPRTDCAFLPEEQKGMAKTIAKKVIESGFVTDADKYQALFEPKNYIYDSKKAPVHHGIIPTMGDAGKLTGMARSVYELICRRFILSLMPNYQFKETRVSFIHNGREFSAKGEVPINLAKSWRALEPMANAPIALPEIKDKENGFVEKVDVEKGKTTAPKPYTEGDLLSDMNGVAKFVTDPNMKKILKETSGIGTPATQASIIETIKARGYVQVVKSGKKEILKSTPYGREVISAIPHQMKDPGLTAIWEETLKSIAEGEYAYDLFMSKIVSFTEKRIQDMKSSSIKVTCESPVKKQVVRAPFSPRPEASSSHRSQKEQQSKASRK